MAPKKSSKLQKERDAVARERDAVARERDAVARERDAAARERDDLKRKLREVDADTAAFEAFAKNDPNLQQQMHELEEWEAGEELQQELDKLKKSLPKLDEAEKTAKETVTTCIANVRRLEAAKGKKHCAGMASGFKDLEDKGTEANAALKSAEAHEDLEAPNKARKRITELKALLDARPLKRAKKAEPADAPAPESLAPAAPAPEALDPAVLAPAAPAPGALAPADAAPQTSFSQKALNAANVVVNGVVQVVRVVSSNVTPTNTTIGLAVASLATGTPLGYGVASTLAAGGMCAFGRHNLNGIREGAPPAAGEAAAGNM